MRQRLAARPVRLGDMQVRDTDALQFLREIDRRRFALRVLQVEPDEVRRDANSHAIRAHHARHGLQHFDRQPHPVFYAAAVFVGAPVRVRRHELL
jgi:hypothetical protein